MWLIRRSSNPCCMRTRSLVRMFTISTISTLQGWPVDSSHTSKTNGGGRPSSRMCSSSASLHCSTVGIYPLSEIVCSEVPLDLWILIQWYLLTCSGIPLNGCAFHIFEDCIQHYIFHVYPIIGIVHAVLTSVLLRPSSSFPSDRESDAWRE